MVHSHRRWNQSFKQIWPPITENSTHDTSDYARRCLPQRYLSMYVVITPSDIAKLEYKLKSAVFAKRSVTNIAHDGHECQTARSHDMMIM